LFIDSFMLLDSQNGLNAPDLSQNKQSWLPPITITR